LLRLASADLKTRHAKVGECRLKIRRILVLGCGGSGKSTFSRRLADATGLDLYHLDSLYWKAGWNRTEASEWEATVCDIVSAENWIVDGSYFGTLEMRLQRADAVVFFDMPRIVCIWRVFKRRLQNLGGANRLGMPKGCPERVYWTFLKWVWRYPEVSKPQVMEKLRLFSQSGRKVFVVTSSRAAEDLLQIMNQHYSVTPPDPKLPA
jgi:adenylate kinase family enzyme